MGRLGDGPRRRETLLGGLIAVTAGGVLAALAPSLAVLVAGRALQGVGLGLVPLAMATARDELPGRAGRRTSSACSRSPARPGSASGYPISGLLAGIDLSAAFWFGALVAAAALVAVYLVVPTTAGRPQARLDTIGATLLAVGLGALLIAIAEGSGWGWGSLPTVGLFVVAIVVLGLWVRPAVAHRKTRWSTCASPASRR